MDMTDEPDEILSPSDSFGDYIVERSLGKGGMGAVCLARAPDGLRFTVKLMHPGRMTHGLRKRFAREAEFAMKIRHRNLISVYDVGEDPDSGLCYIIMDYVSGGTLADLLAERRAKLTKVAKEDFKAKVMSGIDTLKTMDKAFSLLRFTCHRNRRRMQVRSTQGPISSAWVSFSSKCLPERLRTRGVV